MEPIVKTYLIKVVREPGNEPINGVFYDHVEQEFEVNATSLLSAYKVSHLICDIPFRGQMRRTFIDGEEYFDEGY